MATLIYILLLFYMVNHQQTNLTKSLNLSQRGRIGTNFPCMSLAIKLSKLAGVASLRTVSPRGCKQLSSCFRKALLIETSVGRSHAVELTTSVFGCFLSDVTNLLVLVVFEESLPEVEEVLCTIVL